jgi:hypothetical protein
LGTHGLRDALRYRNGMRRVSLWAPPLLYMAVMFAFSAQSQPLPAVTLHVWDKLLHAAE